MVMTAKKLLRITLLCLIVFQIGLIPVYAQEPEEVEPIVVAPSGQLNLTLKQLGHTTRNLTVGTPGATFRFNLPGNFQFSPTGNYFDLITSHFPDTPAQPVTLDVSVNEQLLATVPLTAANAISATTRVNLPAGLLKIGPNNSIRVRLDGASSTCENPAAPLDVVISENSVLSFGYQQVPYPTDLGLYPFPFVEGSLLDNPVTIVLPDQPTANDLSAAATIAAGLGQASKGGIELTAVRVADLTPEIQNNYHLIVLGRPDNNAVLADLELPLPITEANVKPEQGILQEIVSPWNQFRMVLVVSGLDEEGISKASQALNRQANFLGMRGPVAVVVDLLPLVEPDTLGVSSITLAALGYEDDVAYGAEPKEYNFEFTLPLGWRLEEPPIFVFKFAHANILDPNESVLDIKLNGMPVGSTLLDDTNAGDGELVVSLPAHRLRTGGNRLDVGVEMRLPSGDACSNAADQRAWTVISSDSELSLPYKAVDLLPDLSLFPYPFSQNTSFERTAFVVPDQPSSQHLSQLVQLAARLGSASGTKNVTVEVAYPSAVDASIRTGRHLILLGRPSQNTLLREISASLPQPFVADSDLLEPLAVDSVAFAVDPNRDAGLLQITTSPWDNKFILLAIAGTTDRGVDMAVQALLEKTSDLKGNLAVVEPVFNPYSDEPNQISTFSIDTRPPVLNDDEASINPSLPGSSSAGLANRWWK